MNSGIMKLWRVLFAGRDIACMNSKARAGEIFENISKAKKRSGSVQVNAQCLVKLQACFIK